VEGWGQQDVQNVYAGLNRAKKDKLGWLDPALTAAGAVAGSMLMPGVGTLAGASLGAGMGHAAGSVGHSLANGQVDPMQIGQAAMTIGGNYQAGQGQQTAISPQGGGTQPTLPTPSPSVPSNEEILTWYMQNPQSFRHFANGGLVTGPAMDMASQWAQMDPVQRAMLQAQSAVGPEPTAPTPQPYQQAQHPTLEALSQLLPQIMAAMPRPANPKNTKAIGAWLPSAGLALSAPAAIAQSRRASANAPIEAGNSQARADYEARRKAYEDRKTKISDTLVGNATKPFADTAAKPRVPVMLSDWEYMKKHNALPPAIVAEAQANNGTLSAEGYQSFQAAVDNLRGTENAQRQADGLSNRQAGEEQDADALASDVASLSADPTVSMSGRSVQFASRFKVAVNKKLREARSPYNYQQLLQFWNDNQRFTNTQEGQRFQMLRQATVTVRKHLDAMKDFYRELAGLSPPVGLRFAGKTKFQIAVEGGFGDVIQAKATQFMAARDAVATETALVLSSGFSPQKAQQDDAKSKMDIAAYSRAAGESSIAALERILEDRIKSATEAAPVLGGKRNPYFMRLSPLEGWRQSGTDSHSEAGGSANDGFMPDDAVPDPVKGN